MGWAFAGGDHITKEHILVYWLAPIEATLLAVWVFKLLVPPAIQEKTKSDWGNLTMCSFPDFFWLSINIRQVRILISLFTMLHTIDDDLFRCMVPILSDVSDGTPMISSCVIIIYGYSPPFYIASVQALVYIEHEYALVFIR